MKLHLPILLRRCLLFSATFALTCAGVAEAAYQHQDVSIKTYTDFGQNKGRYAVGNTNALLQYLNKDGVQITYTGGQEACTLEHGMIDFDSQVSSGEAAAIGYNFIATVAHVTVVDEHYNGGLMDFTRNNLGRSNSVLYTGIEYAVNGNSSFQLKPAVDYKITRLSKLVTDVSGSAVYGSVDGDYSGITESGLAGELLYRSGSGHMYKTYADGSREWCANPYTYITGGVDTIYSIGVNAPDGCYSVSSYFTYTGDEVGKSEPLPFKADQGDSGSPSWVWNEKTQQYEYLAALQSGNAVNFSQFRGNCEWTNETMASFDVAVTMQADNTIYLNAVTGVGEALSDSGTGASTTLRYGLVTDAEGKELARYNGVASGTHTWKDLSALKDTDNWYNYGDSYLNATKEASSSADMSWADLYHNDNLVISAASETETQHVVLRDTVDLGIGYVQFSLGEGMQRADFEVSAEGAESNLLNSAGYVVDKGVSVHLQLTNPAGYMREWRKVGEGDLYIEGSGNNDVFLNLGGDGVTYLRRTNGYAAYNVLANNGTTVVIDNINQIARDFTFGNRGGVLDMNGNSMVWNNDNAPGAEGFTIHALDEGAIVANRAAGTQTTLTWTQSGNQVWKGSFADTADSALTFIYNGGGTLTMHSILTNLQHARSGVEVQSGKVTLVGTNTEHALGSQGAWNSSARYSSSEDWHYADARMNVSVASGGTFELGSHARLTGDVSVASGGVYVMREGVKHRMEYVEGGYEKEDTDAIRAFFGHKGNTTLAKNATLQVAFSEGTDSTLVYEGNICGEGNVSVNAQSGILKLGGTSDVSGTKVLTQGGLWAASNASLGDTTTNKWVVGEKAWLASDGFTDASQILNYVDSSSTGVLALSRDVEGQIDLRQHTGLIIGAAEGCTVRYGTADESLSAVNGQWVLGGGGGNLEVAFRLSGQNDLILGNSHGKGNVHLSNTGNDFTGDIRYVGGVTLSYDEGALGGAMIDLSYGNRALLAAADISKVKTASTGVVLVDRMATADIDLSSHTGLALASSGDVTYSGNMTLAEGTPYRFGGGDGCLTVAGALASGRDMVIDGQGYTGGSVVFTAAQDFSGCVEITGGKGIAGDVTLRFVEDNSLTGATGFTLINGGSMDLAGTNQQLAGVTLQSGGSIIDSSEGKTSTLTLTSGTMGSGSVVDVAHVVKAGMGTLTLGNSTINFSDFAVEGGTLKLSAEARGSFSVGEGAVYDLNGYNSTGTVTLGEGATLRNVSNLSAALKVQGNSTLACSTSGSELSVAISVAAGAELTVQAGSASFSLGKDSSLSGEGAVSISSSNSSAYHAVSLGGNNSAFSGRLSVTGNGSNDVYFGSVGAFGVGTVVLDNIAFSMNECNTAATTVAATLEVGTKGASFRGGYGGAYYFSDLSGSGTLRSASYGGGAMWFAGNVSGFSGTLDNDSSNLSDDTLRFGFGGAGVNYHSVTGNRSEGAVSLFGEGARLRSSKAEVSYEFNYADKVALNATVEDSAHVTQSGTGTLVLTEKNTSSGTLTIAAGSVELAQDGAWVGSLAGSGTLVNRGANTLSSASGFSGSLELQQSSSLSLGTDGAESFSLGAGQHITVLAGAAGSADSATLNVSSLVLNGGTLSFSGAALVADGGAALFLSDGTGTVSNGGSATQTSLSFFDTSHLAVGQYALLQGNLSGIAQNTYAVSGLDCFNATFSMANSRVLLMTLSAKEGNSIWAGTASQHAWDTGFGGSAPAATDTVWFNDTAEVKEVSITASQQNVEALVFNASEDYTLTANGGDLSAATLELRGTGKVTLGSGIYISGSTTLAADSELVVKDFSSVSDSGISGVGTLTIDAAGQSGSLVFRELGTLRIQGGTYNLSGATTVNTIETTGGQLYISAHGSYGNNIVLGGNGCEGDLRIEGHTNTGNAYRTNLNGTISLAADSTVETVKGNTLFNAKLNGRGHTLTKTGEGLLWLATSTSGGFSADDVSFVVEKGNLRLGGTSSLGVPTGINSVELKKGATLSFCATNSSIDTAFTLEGGSSVDLSSTNNAAATYQFSNSTSLTGSGLVTLSSAAERTLTLDGVVSGTAGFAFAGNGVKTLNLNNANNSFSGGIEAKDTRVTLNLASAGAAGTGDIVLHNAESRVNVAGSSDGSYGIMSNAVSGAASLEISSGRVEMSGSNSYSGSTTVKEGASLRFSGGNTGSSGYVVEKGGSLLLSDTGFITTADKGVTLRAASSSLRTRASAEGSLENVTVTDTAMSATAADSMGVVFRASAEIAAPEYALTQLDLQESRVTVSAENATVSLDGVQLDAATNFTATADGVTLAMSGVMLTLGDAAEPVLTNGGSVATITLQNFDNLALTGSVALDASAVLLPEGDYGYIAVDFGTGVDVSALTATANFGGVSSAALHGESSSVLLFAVPGQAIPEPTGSALALFALSALSLRRRRK